MKCTRGWLKQKKQSCLAYQNPISIGVDAPCCIAMSPLQKLKRALVTILLGLARVYSLDVTLTRDAPDTDVKKAFRRVILRAHPDKPGGSEAAAKKLNEAWGKWLEAGRSRRRSMEAPLCRLAVGGFEVAPRSGDAAPQFSHRRDKSSLDFWRPVSPFPP